MTMIDNDWLNVLGDEFCKPYYKELYQFVKMENESRQSLRSSPALTSSKFKIQTSGSRRVFPRPRASASPEKCKSPDSIPDPLNKRP